MSLLFTSKPTHLLYRVSKHIHMLTSSSTVLLNGVRTRWFKHRRGLRQGDPLSLMLFILAMEPLHHMLDHAAMQGLLSPLAGRGAKLRVSLYADDAAIFVNPQKDDLQTVADVLQLFGEVSGLKTEYREMRCLSRPV